MISSLCAQISQYNIKDRQMHKEKSKNDKGYLFSFNNSLKNSCQATPESSNNVSFQHPFTSSLKTFHTEPYYGLNDSGYPQLFHSTNNKENERCKKGSSINRSKEKSFSKSKSQVTDHFASSKKMSKLQTSKQQERSILAEKSTNILPNVKFNLAESIPLTRKKSIGKMERRSSCHQKKIECSPKREESIKVFVRLKPKSGKELKEKEALHIMNENTIKIEENYYCFDRIFNQQTNQQVIFDNVGSQMCQQLFQGYNGTIFAYGQTGSGKTYTIFGEESVESFGLIYRCIKQILQYKNTHEMDVKIKCSMVQLYKETLIDMFGSCSDLKLKEHKNGQVYIDGLKEVYIHNEKQMMNLVKEGAKMRKVTSTKLNEESSRSHTILSIYLEKSQYTTKLRLIDLAGSEKVCKSGAQGEAFEQTKKINYSLSCLGNVINALTTRNKTEHIPFRDSKLTRLLKDSLTGNFLTSVIVNCSSSEQFLNQTISSLKFAERAKKIKVNVQSLEDELKENETISQLHQIIKKLQFDLDVTTNQLNKYKQKQQISPKKKKERASNPKRILINIPLHKANKKEESLPPVQKPQRCVTNESELTTARNPIPSERAHIQEYLNKYKDKFEIKNQCPKTNNFFLPDFSSLNVSKSIRKLQNSPDISSLSFKYDESPDMSLSFSIQGESAIRQAILNSPS